MPAPAKVVELVGIFECHIDPYTSAEFKETKLREQFINRFCKVLG
jgi:hypothetical protein